MATATEIQATGERDRGQSAFEALNGLAADADVKRKVAELAERVLLADGGRTWGKGKAYAIAEELGLAPADAKTPFGDLLATLDRGPEDDAERALARALAALAVAVAFEKKEQSDKLPEDLLWLATHTPFDGTELLDLALGDRAALLWTRLGDVIKAVDGGHSATVGRAEALVAAAALAGSSASAARRAAALLGESLRDPVLVRILGKGSGEGEKFAGEMMPAPRSELATVLLAVTGVLLILQAGRVVGRFVLAYKRPAEVVLDEASVRIHARTLLLGRTLREREFVIARGGLLRATREVRYPRFAFYAGLLALAVGSYLGVASLVDGVRSASPSLLLAGLLIIAAGVALDFLLTSIVPTAARTCRVDFVPRAGAPVCVGGIDPRRADAALARLTGR